MPFVNPQLVYVVKCSLALNLKEYGNGVFRGLETFFNKKLLNSYCSPNVTTVIQSWRMRWSGVLHAWEI
jgi:hypothetical protein